MSDHPNNLPASDLVLAKPTLDVGGGTSPLDFSGVLLGDASGDPLTGIWEPAV
jgi:hypothetical protein